MNRVLAVNFLKNPYNKELINDERSIFTRKSQASALLYRDNEYGRALVCDFPVNTSLAINKSS